mmetsp:Transcript_15571/g.36054  ORF Transcript_15571/g.36054 Transcript_15571/m.36054 type:complete len:303 (-) Transcript_15571:2058-2966(-)
MSSCPSARRLICWCHTASYTARRPTMSASSAEMTPLPTTSTHTRTDAEASAPVMQPQGTRPHPAPASAWRRALSACCPTRGTSNQASRTLLLTSRVNLVSSISQPSPMTGCPPSRGSICWTVFTCSTGWRRPGALVSPLALSLSCRTRSAPRSSPAPWRNSSDCSCRARQGRSGTLCGWPIRATFPCPSGLCTSSPWELFYHRREPSSFRSGPRSAPRLTWESSRAPSTPCLPLPACTSITQRLEGNPHTIHSMGLGSTQTCSLPGVRCRKTLTRAETLSTSEATTGSCTRCCGVTNSQRGV